MLAITKLDMLDVNAEDLQVWRGPFSWDGLLLRLHIRTVKLDYNAENPHTWPLVKDVVQTENNYDYRQTKPVPRFLAYEQSLMENLVTHRPLVNKVSCRPNLTGHQIKAMFADYPFNFDRYGEMRKYPHLPAEELSEWMKAMKGAIPDTKYIPDTLPRATDATSRQMEVQKENHAPYASTAEHTVETFTVQGAAPPTAVAKMQNEFQALRHRLRNNIYITMSTHLADYNKALHAAIQRTRALELLVHEQHHEAEERAKATNDSIKGLTEQVENQKEELDAAKKETAETNEAIVWVWNEVQRLSKPVAHKREGTDDAVSEKQKKIKVEK